MNPMRHGGEAEIDRTRPLAFTFDGRRYAGFAGDTLASALLANGVRLVARSSKLHRPRGIFSAGLEEPNAFVSVGEGAYREVNVRATEVTLREGLVARSQNCWPALRFDLGGILGFFPRLWPAGFYHKTFTWPAFSWYEPIIRRIAGLGRLPAAPDPRRYATRFHHCDLLVVGAGPAGLAAACAAAAQSVDVVLIDSGTRLGGSLLADTATIEGLPAGRWARERERDLVAAGVLILRGTLALGRYDDNLVTASEQLQADEDSPDPGRAWQRWWKIRAARVVLATGAIERPLVFTNNDRPGVMLASAARTYLRRYAVRAGRRAVLFTNNDSGYEAAFALHEGGVGIAALVDTRAAPGMQVAERARQLGLPVHAGSAVVNTRGRKALRAVEIERVDPAGRARVSRHTVRCDLLCTSGGWDPQLHLYAHGGAKLRYDSSLGSFVAADAIRDVVCVGAANGRFDLESCLEDGRLAGGAGADARAAGSALSINQPSPESKPSVPNGLPASARGRSDRRHLQWVDLAHDVSVCDIELAAAEGFCSVEHMKRYTTAGMAIDQGKTANTNALARLGQATGRAPGAVGTTTFRPPYHPVTMGALAAGRTGELAQRYRRLPIRWHEAHGAVMEDHACWLRPAFYARAGESERAAIEREVRAARSGVALFDSSSLGKIEVCGPDAGEFLNRLYVNNLQTLASGRLRYVMMLNDNGIIRDDGVIARLDEQHYLVNTSSAGALDTHFWMEEWRQCEWRSLKVWIVQQTAQWATLAVSGPSARTVLGALELPLSLDSFAHMRICETELGGEPCRVRRASFTGELCFEIDVAADRAEELWLRLLDAGASHEITPIGMEALDVLRIEKGFWEVGVDTDGDTTAVDMGWGSAIERKPGDFIGRRSLKRPAMQAPDRLQLVGLLPLDARLEVPVGVHALGERGAIEGHVTSSCVSPHLGRSIALGRLRAGHSRKGERVSLDIEGRQQPAVIVDTAFFDPQGTRLHA
jgi:sarcosine oxidase subunit alpha